MARKDVSRDALNAILTHEIRRVEDLEDATLKVKYLLQEPDESGCNWSADFTLNPGSKGSAEYAAPYAARIVDAARKRYNLCA